jgi:hypothetical protein
MEIRLAKAGKPVTGVAEVVAQMQRQLPAQQTAWVRRLSQNPGAFADLERSIHQTFQQLADQVVAGLLAEVTQPAEWAHDAPKK